VDYYYTKAASGTTGKFQLMLRTNQFPTRARQYRNKTVQSPKCDLCDSEAVQDEKHLFVDCPAFTHMREEAIRKSFTFRKTAEKDEPAREDLEKYYRETIFGSETWDAKPWLGIVPKPKDPLQERESGTAHHLAIILTSRIAGEYFRRRERSKARPDIMGSQIPR
jgi:hypothetical protein